MVYRMSFIIFLGETPIYLTYCTMCTVKVWQQDLMNACLLHIISYYIRRDIILWLNCKTVSWKERAMIQGAQPHVSFLPVPRKAQTHVPWLPPRQNFLERGGWDRASPMAKLFEFWVGWYTAAAQTSHARRRYRSRHWHGKSQFFSATTTWHLSVSSNGTHY